MKKVMMRVVVAAVVCIACQSFADTVNWYSAEIFSGPNGISPFDVGYKYEWDYSGQWDDATMGSMADRGYMAVPQTSDWAVRVLTVGSEIEVARTWLGGSHWADAGMDGAFYHSFDYNSNGNPFNGQAIFTRFYNNADWQLADGYADAGFTTISWPSAVAPNPPNEYFYNVGKVAIAVIPEPSTALLLGTGGLVVFLGRRKLNRDSGTKVTPKKMRKVDLLNR